MTGPGCEWVIEALGCNPARLKDLAALRLLFSDMVEAMNLHPVAEAQWHQFPGPGGITGLCLLAESHLACHTFPEHGSLCLNIFCCKPRPNYDFVSYLSKTFEAQEVRVRFLDRPYCAS